MRTPLAADQSGLEIETGIKGQDGQTGGSKTSIKFEVAEDTVKKVDVDLPDASIVFAQGDAIITKGNDSAKLPFVTVQYVKTGPKATNAALALAKAESMQGVFGPPSPNHVAFAVVVVFDDFLVEPGNGQNKVIAHIQWEAMCSDKVVGGDQGLSGKMVFQLIPQKNVPDGTDVYDQLNKKYPNLNLCK